MNNGYGEPGDTTTVPIVLSDGDGVAGFQVEVLYDPIVLAPVGVILGADTAAAGGWAVVGSNVAPGDFRVLGSSNPPAGLPAGLAEVALVQFSILAGIPNDASPLDLDDCILSDEFGLPLRCQLCPEPGGIIVRPASSFEFRPVADPVGVDLFDPLLPASTPPLKIEANDPTFLISGTSAPFRGAAKGDLDANNVVDVVRVSNKALGLPALCPCNGSTNQGATEAAMSAAHGMQPVVQPSGPLGFRLKKAAGGQLLLQVSGADDLGGFRFDLLGAGPETEVTLDGLTEGGDWVVASSFHKGLLRVIAYSTTANGVNGDGTVLRIRLNGSPRSSARPRLYGIVASDSRGRQLKTH